MITSSMSISRPVSLLARVGLIAKGIVYCLLGVLAVKSALGAGKTSEATKEGAMNWVEHWPAGKVILVIIGLGILCYTAWRWVQAARGTRKTGWKDMAARLRYALSGLLYLSIALFALKGLTGGSSGSGGGGGAWSSTAESFFGHWIVYLVAAIIAAVGLYQIWYAWSDRYRKHVDELQAGERGSRIMLQFGKIGYIARGLVWLTIAFLIYRGAAEMGSGDQTTSRAFQFLGQGSYGPYLLGGVAAGLICYGLFCFVRARWESAARQEG